MRMRATRIRKKRPLPEQLGDCFSARGALSYWLVTGRVGAGRGDFLRLVAVGKSAPYGVWYCHRVALRRSWEHMGSEAKRHRRGSL